MTRARIRITAESGFTLIEMMLAVAILGLIMAMLFSSFHAVAGSKVQAENRIAVDQAARTVMWELSSELRGAVQTPLIPSYVLMVGRANMRDGRPVDSIMFSTLDPTHRRAIEGFGAEEIVSYTIAPNPNHPGWYFLIRHQQSALLGQTISSDAPGGVLLVNNLISLHFRYFDGENWSESWDSQSLPPGRSLPQEIEIELQMGAASGNPYSLSTFVTLPMAFSEW